MKCYSWKETNLGLVLKIFFMNQYMYDLLPSFGVRDGRKKKPKTTLELCFSLAKKKKKNLAQ